MVIAMPAVNREGFSPDEEVTALVVASSSLIGVPTLPSGVVYLRGVLYVKLAGTAGWLLTPELPAYRLVSLMFGLGNVVLIALVARLWLMPAAAPVAAVLLAASPLHAAVSVFARPYSAAVFCLLLACLVIPRALENARTGRWFLALVAVAQAVHEAGVLLVLVPLAYALTREAEDRRGHSRAVRLVLKTAVVAAGLQGLFGAWFSASVSARLGTAEGPLAVFVLRSIPWPPLYVPALAGPIGLGAAAALSVTLAFWMRARLRLTWIALIPGAACAGSFLLGPLLAGALLGMLAQPRRARAYLTAVMAFGIVSAAGWTLHTALVTDAALSWRLGLGLARSSLGYPFDWVWFLARQFPVAAACVVTTGLFGADARLSARFTGVMTWLTVVMFGVLQIVAHDRYVVMVMPLVLLLAALAVARTGMRLGSMASRQAPSWLAPGTGALAACALTVALLFEQHAYAKRPDSGMWVQQTPGIGYSYAPSTFFGDPSARECRASVPAHDLLVCNDELACRYLFTRVDGWLLTDPGLRRVCAVERNGVWRGIYAGSLVLEDERALVRFLSTNPGRNVTVALLATPKFGYPEQELVTRRVAQSRGIAARSCGDTGLILRFEH